MDSTNPAWLPTDKPFFTPKEVRVNTPDGSRSTADSMMQVQVAQYVNRPHGFVWGTEPNPARLIQLLSDYASGELMNYSWSPYTTIDFDPTERAYHYYGVIMDILKHIPATYVDQTLSPSASVYDLWVKA